MASNKALWEINAKIEMLAEQMDDLQIVDGKYINTETGECFELNVFDELEIEHDEKMKNCLYVVKRMKQQEAGIEGQINFLKQQLAGLENRLDSMVGKRKWFEGYLIDCTKAEPWKAKDKSCGCYTKETPSADIIDENLLPDEYKTFKTTSAPNKKLITDAIVKNGIKIPGAGVKYSKSLVVK